MKNWEKNDGIKVIFILLLGLVVSLFIYPFIHELGHVVASLCVGAEVLDIELFPLPNVLCNVGTIGNVEKVIIGFGGILLPLVMAYIVPRKLFWTWYVRVILKGISLLAFIISVISVTANCNQQDDMVQVFKYWFWPKSLLIIILCYMIISITISVAREKPLKQIHKYFKI